MLHDSVYRETYAQNLKRDFPRVPLYSGQWADWGERLMTLHVGYDTIEPWPLQRTDTPDLKSREGGVPPRVILKADSVNGVMVLDSETKLSDVPPAAWHYHLALDWILDQYKGKGVEGPDYSRQI
ncbi:MAG: type ISP restriction/modification enzyme [Bradyrhizobium sp.]|uniref:type ISP restriction/modification enzyme n=1 Tax=Bradyrhizobium sp. TaxID=376 RepID=UPI002725DA80|nr:type ISP restriction/modification enzyme [Bradyrhizobium sp.]MDO8397610.1 type ISP restriction/modification enzyme [Bradyrhizobium sp.]